MHEVSEATTGPASSPIFQSLNELAKQYRLSNSIEEKDDYRQSLDLILKLFPNDNYDRDLRKSGLPELVLQAAIETRSLINKGSVSGSSVFEGWPALTYHNQPTANLAFSAISTLQKLVNKIDLHSDGYIFAQTLLTNFESIARQIIELAEQLPLGISDIYDPILRIIIALISSSNSHHVFTSAAGPSILRVLLESLLRPDPDNIPSVSRWHTYRLLSRKISRKPGAVSESIAGTILQQFPTETKAILSRYSTQHVVTQLARSVGGRQNETSLWQFYEIVYKVNLIDQSLQANLLWHSKLYVPMANAWWEVGRAATVPIRPDDVSAAFSWDPVALSCIEECVREARRQLSYSRS
ncbi:hypothetical protein FS837_008949 [Tulasnella sp. UAMH 9824]|nr:hypothetical protein FS837_008949 [Tulasnella sp. UAMH 9824]